MGTEAWSAFTNRTNLSDNNNAQVMLLDTTVAAASQNQRTPVTQILRSGMNLSDVSNAFTATTNLGATSANTINAIVRRDGSGLFNAGGATFSAGSSGFNITGTNPACNLGTNFNVGQSSASGAFFTGAVAGDCILRQSNTGFSIMIGVGSDAPELQVLSNSVLTRANVSITTSASPSLLVSTNTTLAQVTTAATFFTTTLAGDTVLKNANTSSSIQIGIGNGTPQAYIDNTRVTFRVNPNIIPAAGNPSIDVGADCNFAQIGNAGALFTNTVVGDAVVRNQNNARTLRMGVGTGTSQLDIIASEVVSNVPFVCAGNGTFSGGTVTSTAVNTGSINATIINMDDTHITQATADAQFFTDVVTGDTVIVNTENQTIRLGVTTGASLVRIDNSSLVCDGSIISTTLISAEEGNFNDTLNVGGSPAASAVLTASSTTQGFMPPRMTTTQKNAISSPASGLIVYDSTLGKLCVRGALAWETITSV